MGRESRIPSGPKEAFEPVDPSEPSYPETLVEYCCREFMVADRQVMQVYEELVHLAYWLRGFAPHNVMEIGTSGATFFVLSRLATGKKVAVDIRDLRPRIHNFMFGHEWRFFQGDSQTSEMLGDIRRYCDAFDVVLIDGDHRYEGVKRDFENYRQLLSERGVILLHDVDPEHVFKGGAGGDAWHFWRQLDEGTKTTLCCNRSSGRVEVLGESCHFGGIGIWRPH